MTANSLTRTAAARPFAIVSGAFGLAAGVCFVFFLAYGDPAGFASDVLGWVQLVALSPVALALRGRMPATRATRIACAVVAAAAVLTPVIDIVTGRRSIWPGAVCTYLVFVWIFLVSLTGHRRRGLPRPVTRAGLLISAGASVGLVLLLPGLVTPDNALRQAFRAAGVGISLLAWLGQPVFTLLLATFVFKEEK